LLMTETELRRVAATGNVRAEQGRVSAGAHVNADSTSRAMVNSGRLHGPSEPTLETAPEAWCG
jgi:hypothetical protein